MGGAPPYALSLAPLDVTPKPPPLPLFVVSNFWPLSHLPPKAFTLHLLPPRQPFMSERVAPPFHPTLHEIFSSAHPTHCPFPGSSFVFAQMPRNHPILCETHPPSQCFASFSLLLTCARLPPGRPAPLPPFWVSFPFIPPF